MKKPRFMRRNLPTNFGFNRATYFLKKTDENVSKTDEGQASNLDADTQIYSLFRDYIKHEDNLTNNRLSWVLTIHGFLYTSYSFILQKELEVTSSLYSKPSADLAKILDGALCSSFHQIDHFLFGIALIGIVISLSGLIATWSAQMSLVNVSKLFRIQHKGRHIRIDRTYKRQPKYIPSYNNRKFPIAYLVSSNFYLPGIAGGGQLIYARGGSVPPLLINFALFCGWIASIYYNFDSYSQVNNLLCRYNLN